VTSPRNRWSKISFVNGFVNETRRDRLIRERGVELGGTALGPSAEVTA
jgi:hypothetical protein